MAPYQQFRNECVVFVGPNFRRLISKPYDIIRRGGAHTCTGSSTPCRQLKQISSKGVSFDDDLLSERSRHTTKPVAGSPPRQS